MDWLIATFQWLMVNQPPFPWSLIFGLFGVFWALMAYAAYKSDEEDDWIGMTIVGAVVIAVIWGWYPLVSIGIGMIGIPLIGLTLFGLVVGAMATCSGLASVVRAWWKYWAKKRKAQQLAQEAAREEKGRTPEAVIARCEAAVSRYADRITSDPNSAQKIREAAGKVESLKALYKLLHAVQQPTPLPADDDFDKLLTQVDGIFPDVSLLERKELIKQLRDECRPPELDTQTAEAIQGEIEALVLTIESLPQRAMHQFVAERTHEADVAAESLRQAGIALPPITVQPQRSSSTRKRQTA